MLPQVILNNMKIISGLTLDQREELVKDLTYPNPAYQNAQRYSKFAGKYTSPVITYYETGKGYISVPRGYDISFPYKIVSDGRLENTDVNYPKFCVKLRGTQREAVDAYIDAVERGGNERGVIIIPTGKGKSIIGIKLAQKLKQRCLVIVQKDDLIDGWKKDCRLALGLRPKQVGLIKAQDFRLGEQITLTTIQTLSKLDISQIRDLTKYFGMVIVDEFHHSVAKTYTLINYFPAKYRIGLTATAKRNDGLEGVLYHYFGGKAFEYAEQEEDEDIIPAKDITIVIRDTKVTWNPERYYWFSKLGGKYTEEDIRKMLLKLSPSYRKLSIEEVGKQKVFGTMKMVPLVNAEARKAIAYNDEFNNSAVKDIITEINQRKSCIVFCHEKAHCDLIYRALLAKGVKDKHIQIFSGDSKDSKTQIKSKAESKEKLVTIATFSIATEGTNVKAWERGFLLSSIANEKDVIQCIGRLRRRNEGKDKVIIYDYRFPLVAGNSNHGMIRDRTYLKMGFRIKKEYGRK